MAMASEQNMSNERSDRDASGAQAVRSSRLRRLAQNRTAWLILLGVAGIVVVVDQVTKRLVDSHLLLYQSWPSESWPVHLVHTSNTGAAFSILQDQTTFLTLTSIIGLAAILLFFFYPPFDHVLLRFALGLQLGGAIGNLIDRVVFGSVTDFVAFPHYPAFNVADSSIVVGVAILMWFLLFGEEHGRNPQTP